jgi:sec-independent protein translocase protein TatC
VKEMTLLEHLTELRKALIKIVIILCLSFFVCYGQSDNITEILLKPLKDAMNGTEGLSDAKIVYLGIFDQIYSQCELSFWSSIIFSSPLWFWQVWNFVRPGLYEKEVKQIRPFIIMGFFLFIFGVCFGLFLALPLSFKVLLDFGMPGVTASFGVKDYLSAVIKILVGLGLMFQLPNALVILGRLGIINQAMISGSRNVIYVILATLSAILTPPDVMTMMVMWIPLIILFEVGVLAMKLLVPPPLDLPAPTEGPKDQG